MALSTTSSLESLASHATPLCRGSFERIMIVAPIVINRMHAFVPQSRYVCSGCGVAYESTQDQAANYQQAVATVRTTHHLLAPPEIRHVRTQLGLSVEELAIILLVSAHEIVAWENGTSLQSPDVDSRLIAYRDTPDLAHAVLLQREAVLRD